MYIPIRLLSLHANCRFRPMALTLGPANRFVSLMAVFPRCANRSARPWLLLFAPVGMRILITCVFPTGRIPPPLLNFFVDFQRCVYGGHAFQISLGCKLIRNWPRLRNYYRGNVCVIDESWTFSDAETRLGTIAETRSRPGGLRMSRR